MVIQNFRSFCAIAIFAVKMTWLGLIQGATPGIVILKTIDHHEIEVPSEELPGKFLSERTSFTIDCPATIDSEILGNAIRHIKILLSHDTSKLSDKSRKVLICERLVPEILKDFNFDEKRTGLFVEALQFFEVPDDILYEISAELEKKFTMILEKSLARNVALENYVTLFDSHNYVKSLIQTLPSRSARMPDFSVEAFIRSYAAGLRNPPPDLKRKIALGFLQVATPNVFIKDLLDKQSWQSLEMFCGSKQSPGEFVAAKLDRTVTEMGRVSFYSKLAMCKSDIQDCENQRDLIAYLSRNKEFTNSLENAFQRIKASENVVLSFWNSHDPFEANFYELLFSVGSFKDYRMAKALSSYINSNYYMLEFGERLGQFYSTLGLGASIFFTGATFVSSLSGNAMEELYWTRLATLGLACTSSWSILLSSSQFINRLRSFVYMRLVFHLKLKYLVDYLNAVNIISGVLNEAAGERSTPKALKVLAKKLDFLQQSAELRELYDDLQSSTFQGERDLPAMGQGCQTVLTKSMGFMITCYQKMLRSKHLLVPIIASVGELDAQLSVSRLLNEYEGQRVTYCLPKFVKKATPFINITDAWNPMVNKDEVKQNSLTIGTEGKCHAAVLTGPNAGGKSTITKSFILAIIMAQSLGIAPAQSLTFTPFGSIRAYLNIADDTAGGNSLFVASANRALELYNSALKAKNDNLHSLTVFDELFNGTSAAEGEAAAYALLTSIVENRRNILLATTHFKKLTSIKGIDTYKVTVEKTADGNLHYPFKLEEGISDQIIAFDVLREKGFNERIIKLAETQIRRNNLNASSSSTQ